MDTGRLGSARACQTDRSGGFHQRSRVHTIPGGGRGMRRAMERSTEGVRAAGPHSADQKARGGEGQRRPATGPTFRVSLDVSLQWLRCPQLPGPQPSGEMEGEGQGRESACWSPPGNQPSEAQRWGPHNQRGQEFHSSRPPPPPRPPQPPPPAPLRTPCSNKLGNPEINEGRRVLPVFSL